MKLIWRVVPLPDDETAENCVCIRYLCVERPTGALERGESMWYICDEHTPKKGWSLRCPDRPL